MPSDTTPLRRDQIAACKLAGINSIRKLRALMSSFRLSRPFRFFLLVGLFGKLRPSLGQHVAGLLIELCQCDPTLIVGDEPGLNDRFCDRPEDGDKCRRHDSGADTYGQPGDNITTFEDVLKKAMGILLSLAGSPAHLPSANVNETARAKLLRGC